MGSGDDLGVEPRPVQSALRPGPWRLALQGPIGHLRMPTAVLPFNAAVDSFSISFLSRRPSRLWWQELRGLGRSAAWSSPGQTI